MPSEVNSSPCAAKPFIHGSCRLCQNRKESTVVVGIDSHLPSSHVPATIFHEIDCSWRIKTKCGRCKVRRRPCCGQLPSPQAPLLWWLEQSRTAFIKPRGQKGHARTGQWELWEESSTKVKLVARGNLTSGWVWVRLPVRSMHHYRTKCKPILRQGRRNFLHSSTCQQIWWLWPRCVTTSFGYWIVVKSFLFVNKCDSQRLFYQVSDFELRFKTWKTRSKKRLLS